MDSNKNNLKYILNLIVTAMESQDNLVVQLHNIVLKSYKAVRIDNTILDDLCDGLNDLIYFIID
jgi:hypothetical protein